MGIGHIRLMVFCQDGHETSEPDCAWCLAVEAGPTAPPDMTPEKLRLLAAWLDKMDRIARAHIALCEKHGEVPTADALGAFTCASSTEVQNDLRRWADMLEES